MSFHRLRSERGFTLVEVLLAVSLVAVIATMVFSALYLSATAIDQARTGASQERILRSTLRLMAEELSTSINHATAPWIGVNAQQDSQPADTMAFLSVGQFRGTDWAAETETVRILYTRDEDRLLRVVKRNLFGLTDDSIDHMTLAVKVKAFNVRYYDRTSSVWADEWDGRARNGVPGAVLMELTFAPDKDTAEPQTIRQWVSLGMRS